MKIETTAKLLKSALGLIAPAINPKHPVPAMTCVVFDGQTVRGTNFEMEITVPFVAEIDGKMAVDFARLKSLVGSIPADGTVTIVSGERDATVKFGRSRYKLPTVNPDDVYALNVGEGVSFEPSDDFASAVAFCLAHAGQNASMPQLEGVFIEGDKVVGTQGKTLGWRQLPDDSGLNLVLPPETCAVIAATGKPTKITANERLVEIVFDSMTLKSKLMGGQYPDWKRVLPKVADGMSTITVATDTLAGVVRRIQSVGSLSGAPQVTIVSATDFVAIGTLDGDGRMAREILIEGDQFPPIEISAACSFILDICDAQKGNAELSLTVDTSKKGQPVIIAGDESGQSILMQLHPLRPSLADDIVSAFAGGDTETAEAA